MFSRNHQLAIGNALIQASALVLSNQSIIWPTYIVMGMACWLVLLQTIGAASLISKSGTSEIQIPPKEVYTLRLLVAVMYFASTYNMYKLGYEVLAGVFFAHILIYFLTSFFGLIKDWLKDV